MRQPLAAPLIRTGNTVALKLKAGKRNRKETVGATRAAPCCNGPKQQKEEDAAVSERELGKGEGRCRKLGRVGGGWGRPINSLLPTFRRPGPPPPPRTRARPLSPSVPPARSYGRNGSLLRTCAIYLGNALPWLLPRVWAPATAPVQTAYTSQLDFFSMYQPIAPVWLFHASHDCFNVSYGADVRVSPADPLVISSKGREVLMILETHVLISQIRTTSH